MKDITIRTDKKELEIIAKEYELNYLVLFGSRAEGAARKTSDYDLAFSSKKEIDYGEEALLAEKLCRVFKIKNIDLVNLASAGPLLMQEVAQKGALVAEFTPLSFDKFQIYAFMRYIEAKPLFKMKEEYVRNG